MSRRAVIFGCGKIGRGFLGQLFHGAGYHITFVDVVPAVVEAINTRGWYEIRIAAEGEPRIRVDDIDAVSFSDEAAVTEVVVDAAIAATAVGVPNLRATAPHLAAGLCERIRRGIVSPLDVIVCENLLEGAEILRAAVLELVPSDLRPLAEERFGTVASVVGRMVPVPPPDVSDPLWTRVEEYAILPVDRHGFAGPVPDIPGVEPCDDIFAYEERKLFTHNAGHAVAAYVGHLRGYTYLYEAMADGDVQRITRGAMAESGVGLIAKHGFDPDDYQAHVDDLIRRFSNRALGDQVARVAAQPIRKLGPRDRLVGAAHLALSYGARPRCLALGIAAAMRYRNPDDPQAVELAGMVEREGPDAVLTKICGLAADDPLRGLVGEALSAIDDGSVWTRY